MSMNNINCKQCSFCTYVGNLREKTVLSERRRDNRRPFIPFGVYMCKFKFIELLEHYGIDYDDDIDDIDYIIDLISLDDIINTSLERYYIATMNSLYNYNKGEDIVFGELGPRLGGTENFRRIKVKESDGTDGEEKVVVEYREVSWRKKQRDLREQCLQEEAECCDYYKSK